MKWYDLAVWMYNIICYFDLEYWINDFWIQDFVIAIAFFRLESKASPFF